MKNPIYYLLILMIIITACKKNEGESNWTDEDQAYYEHILDLQNQGSEDFMSWLEIMDSLDAINQLQQFFLADTAVESAIIGSQGIAIDYKNGMRGGIMLNPEDFYDEEKSMPQRVREAEVSPDGFKSMVNNSKMIFLNPTYWERSNLADNVIVENTEDLERVSYELKTIYKDRDANLDRFSDLGGYGIIRIYSHGWPHPTKWDIVETYMQTGESVSNGTTKKYGDDIKSGKIMIINVKNVNSQLDPSPVYFISKDFITGHNDFSKDTVFFYGGFCFSFLGTWPLIEESFAKGTYLGFSWRVRTNFNCNLGNAAIDYLSDTAGTTPKTAGQFMAEPNPVKEMWDQQDNVMCRLRYSGDADLTLWTKTQVTTNPVTDIDSVSATCGGTITASTSTVIEARGVCWSTYANPTVNDDFTTNGSGTGSFTSELKDLTPATPYYVRAYATIKNGQTIYGNEVSFTTSSLGGGGVPCPGMPEFTDGRDGTTYPTVQIGSQCWLKKNMTVEVADHSWCYNDDPASCETYGRLYDYQGALEACPGGWHLPSETEWMELINYLGGEAVAGRKLKETGYEHWGMPNPNTNESGFTALGTGYRSFNAGFQNITEITGYFSTTEIDIDWAWGVSLPYLAHYTIQGNHHKKNAYSVRCLRD